MTLTGNWTGQNSAQVSDFTFAFSAIVAFLLNNLFITIIVAGTWSALKVWRKAMETLTDANAVKFRDVELKVRLSRYITQLSPEKFKDREQQDGLREDLDSIFRRANEGLPESIVDAYPESGEEYLKGSQIVQNLAQPRQP